MAIGRAIGVMQIKQNTEDADEIPDEEEKTASSGGYISMMEA